MAIAGQLQCELIRGNTGVNRCSVSPSVWVYYLLVPTGTVPTATNLASFQSYLQARLVDDNPVTRWFLVGRLVGIEDNSEDPQNFTYPDGTNVNVRGEVYNWSLEHKNGFCYHKNLMAFNNSQMQYQVYMIDAASVMWGMRALDTNSLPTIAPVTMSQHYVGAFKTATFTDPSRFMVMVGITDTTQLNEDGIQAKLGFNVASLRGVQGVTLTALGGNNWTTGVLNVSAFTACDGLNFVEEFGTEIADPDAWVVTNGTTGAVIPVTAVTALANGNGFALDLDQTSPNYPTSGGSAKVRLADISDLADLNVTYYESDTITITRP